MTYSRANTERLLLMKTGDTFESYNTKSMSPFETGIFKFQSQGQEQALVKLIYNSADQCALQLPVCN